MPSSVPAVRKSLGTTADTAEAAVSSARRPRPPCRLQLSTDCGASSSAFAASNSSSPTSLSSAPASSPAGASASAAAATAAAAPPVLLPSPLCPISANPCVAPPPRKRRTCMGGFLCFSANYPQYCESKTTGDPEVAEKPAVEPNLQQGPTQVLSFLYVGSQADALDEDVIRRHGITHVLNVSSTCPQSRHVPPDNFLRIAVNDGYVDRLLPHFQQAFQFLENVRETSGRCLVHCLAGISRSPTLSIAYIMKHKKMSHEDAYKFVKDKRTNISPNFNFLGQLLEFEKQLKRSESFSEAASPADADCWEAKRQRTAGIASSHSQPAGFLRPPPPPPIASAAQSPTTALSRLSFTPCAASASAAASAGAVHLPEFPGTSLEQVAVTPCRSAAVGGTASAPPTPPPPQPPPRTSSRRGVPPASSSSSAAPGTGNRPRSVVLSAAAAAAAAAAVRKSQSENFLDDRDLAATFAAAAAAAAAAVTTGSSSEGRSRSLENLDACTGGSLKSLSSSASNGSHGSQEILTYS